MRIIVECNAVLSVKSFQFTIFNPISSINSIPAPTPETTATPAGTPAKATRFLQVIFTVSALLLAWRLGREKS